MSYLASQFIQFKNEYFSNNPIKKWAEEQNGHTDGKQTREKNVQHYRKNANQNYNEVLPHTGKNGHHQKVAKINAGEVVEKGEFSCTICRNEN